MPKANKIKLIVMVTLQYDYLNLVTWTKTNQSKPWLGTMDHELFREQTNDFELLIPLILIPLILIPSPGKQNFPEYCTISKHPVLDVELYRSYLYSLKPSASRIFADGQTEAARKPLKQHFGELAIRLSFVSVKKERLVEGHTLVERAANKSNC